MGDKITIEIGRRGCAFDSPDYLRGFTYTEQPNGEHAFTIGRACNHAMAQSAGDWIDLGLNLLKTLEAEGYGVFMLPKRIGDEV